VKVFAVSYSEWASYPASLNEYDFGTNWSVFSDSRGPGLGRCWVRKVLTGVLRRPALGVMLFALGRVAARV